MAKWDSKRKLARNKALYEYADANPDLSQQEIGEVFGISNTRVSKLLAVRRKRDKEAK